MPVSIAVLQREWKSIFALGFRLARVNFNLRNEGSYLGVFWYLLNPLVMFGILFSLRKVIVGNPIAYYPAYLMLGIIMFNLFSQTTMACTRVITKYAGLIKSTRVPTEALVLAEIIQALFSHAFELAIFVLLCMYIHLPLTPLLWYPLVLFWLILFTSGVSFLLAILSAHVADLVNAWQVLISILWFTIPIYYVATLGDLPFFSLYNPLFYFLANARDLVIYHEMPSLAAVCIMIGASVLSFMIGLVVFERSKHLLAESV